MPGFSSGHAIAAMEKLTDENLPDGLTYKCTDLSYQEKNAGNTAILIVEFARRQEAQGKPRVAAVMEARRLWLRPILMTSFAFILGVVQHHLVGKDAAQTGDAQLET